MTRASLAAELRDLARGPATDRTHRIMREAANAIDLLQTSLLAARYAPMGDNHHNAVECPYCNPKDRP